MRLTSTGYECELLEKDPVTGGEIFAAAGGLTECKMAAKIFEQNSRQNAQYILLHNGQRFVLNRRTGRWNKEKPARK